jgi:MoxR-like ATPase
MNPPQYPVDQGIVIDAQGTWPASVHLFKAPTAAALRAAEATGRPLLVRGLPGVGKSETARAAAAFALRPLLPVVIDGRTEPEDLKWRVDAVKRLSDAQGRRAKTELAYVRPGVLWYAYDWDGAHAQARRAGLRAGEAVAPAGWDAASDRSVVLLDEIDKADPDLPNALLEVLANTGFTPPFAGGRPVACSEATRPLVVITTNEERELPAAFLRRCLVLTLELPKERAALLAELLRLAREHAPRWPRPAGVGDAPLIDEPQIRNAADLFLDVRAEAQRKGDYLPSTSEFLDLVRALASLYPGDATAQEGQLGALLPLVTKSLQPGTA